jgi:hypothetical protein
MNLDNWNEWLERIQPKPKPDWAASQQMKRTQAEEEQKRIERLIKERQDKDNAILKSNKMVKTFESVHQKLIADLNEEELTYLAASVYLFYINPQPNVRGNAFTRQASIHIPSRDDVSRLMNIALDEATSEQVPYDLDSVDDIQELFVEQKGVCLLSGIQMYPNIDIDQEDHPEDKRKQELLRWTLFRLDKKAGFTRDNIVIVASIFDEWLKTARDEDEYRYYLGQIFSKVSKGVDYTFNLKHKGVKQPKWKVNEREVIDWLVKQEREKKERQYGIR